ncbi:MAG: magnesium transporter CorA family protein [Coriobacteriales bacterium]
MIECLKTTVNGTNRIDQPEPGCWVNIVAPDEDERSWLQNVLGVVPEFVRSALDDEEQSHVDYDDDTGQVLVIVDCPFVEEAGEQEDPSIVQYDTHPLSFLFLREQDMMVSVSLRENETVSAFVQGRERQINTNQRTRLLLQILLRISQRYLACLKNIYRQFNENERILHQTMRNEELIKMLGFEKSLVYFSTSLKSSESTLTRISSGRFIKLYEDDRDLLDDVFIEIRQAMEMCTIYTNILNGTMETFGSVINNNLNLTMRTLTFLTVILSIPTMVFSFWGMNVGLPFTEWFVIPLTIAIVLAIVVLFIFRKSRFFK